MALISSLVAAPDGDLFFAGSFEGSATFGNTTLKPVPSRLEGSFVGRTDAAGNPKWVKTVSPGANVGGAFARDAQGNLYSGSVMGCDNTVIPIGKDSLDSRSCSYMFTLAKLNAAGELLWIRDWPPEKPASFKNTSLYSLAVGADGSVYVAGTTAHEPVTVEPWLGTEIVLAVFKFDAQGNRIWKRVLHTSDYEGLNSLSVHPDGNLYATGGFEGKLRFKRPDGAWDSLQSAGGRDILLCSWTPDGTLRFAQRSGGPGSDGGEGLFLSGTAIHVVGFMEGEGDLNALVDPDPLFAQTAMTARYDLSGNPLGYRKVPDSLGRYFSGWNRNGDVTHLLMIGMDRQYWVRMRDNGPLSVDAIPTLKVRDPRDSAGTAWWYGMALASSGEPTLFGAAIYGARDAGRFDPLLAKWSDLPPLSIRRGPALRPSNLLGDRLVRDLLGRRKVQLPAGGGGIQRFR